MQTWLMTFLFRLMIPLMLLTSCSKELEVVDDEEPLTPFVSPYQPGLRKTLRVLAFGNSFTRNALGYVPFLLEGINPDYNIHLQMACLGGGSLRDHLAVMRHCKGYETDLYEAESDRWTKLYSRSDSLLMQKWDLILFNQVSTEAADMDSYKVFSGLLSYVTKYQSDSCRVGWLLTHSLPKKSHEKAFLGQCACVKHLCEQNMVSVVIPSGTALENARWTHLDKVAVGSHLTWSDNWHLQEGIPCLVESYAAASAILRWAGISEVHLPLFLVDRDFLIEKCIPCDHPQPTPCRKRDVEMAIRCAEAAVESPLKVIHVQ